MKHKKFLAIIALSIISACGVALLLLGARADRERDLALLPLPRLTTCKSAAHPLLPKRWRAIFLMAPFTTGQLIVTEIVHDAALPATRLILYGVERGVADFLILGDTTYLLSSAETETGSKNCTDLGDTGWRPLPADWLTDTSRCAGSGPVLKTPTNWWTTAFEPAPSSYWILSKQSDGTPFRLVFANPTDRLAALGRFALSHQLAFDSVERTDLADIAVSCRQAMRSNSVAGATRLTEVIDAMAHSPFRADAAIARLFPSLKHLCDAPNESLWMERLALNGVLTPFDSNMDPMPMEVMYDWNVPGQRSRVFPNQGNIAAHDYLLLRSGGYNVSHRADGAAMCEPGLPGTIRPDWSQRAPCKCSAQIDGGTPLTPDEPIKILSCPLNAPRIAWAWYTRSGRPVIFMVTSTSGDQGSGSFAVLDYHQWIPHLPIAPSTFAKPPQCPDSPIAQAGMPNAAVATCTTCHSSGANR
jgi:hypothetical protein